MAMELTADQLASVSASLNLAGVIRDPSERRRTPRRDVRAVVSVALVEDGESGPPLSMRVRNLSPSGVLLQHEQALKFGQQFVLNLPRNEGSSVQILCTVMNCRVGRGKLYHIGAEFTCALSAPPAPVTPMEGEIDRIRRSLLQ
jgi:hypothetical protein